MCQIQSFSPPNFIETHVFWNLEIINKCHSFHGNSHKLSVFITLIKQHDLIFLKITYRELGSYDVKQVGRRLVNASLCSS